MVFRDVEGVMRASLNLGCEKFSAYTILRLIFRKKWCKVFKKSSDKITCPMGVTRGGLC